MAPPPTSLGRFQSNIIRMLMIFRYSFNKGYVESDRDNQIRDLGPSVPFCLLEFSLFFF